MADDGDRLTRKQDERGKKNRHVLEAWGAGPSGMCQAGPRVQICVLLGQLVLLFDLLFFSLRQGLTEHDV